MQAYDQDYYLDLLSSYPLESLDESGVDSLFSHLGYAHYSSNLLEHGITGQVLIHLDHTALKDVGVHSVGQRLNILKTVYVLKVLSNIPIEEGHYVPPSEELQDGQIPSSQIIALLTERDDRIRNLENEVQHLHVALQSLKEEALTIARTAASNGKPRPSLRSPTSSSFPHPLSNASTLSRSNSLSNPSTAPSNSTSSTSSSHPRPRAAPTQFLQTQPPTQLQNSNNLPDSPHSPIPLDSPRIQLTDYQSQQQQQQGSSSQLLHPSSQSHLTVSGGSTSVQSSEISIDGIKTPTTPTVPLLQQQQQSQSQLSTPSQSQSQPHSSSSSSSRPSTSDAQSSSRTTRERDPSSSGGGTGGDSNNPYRSFRVTLEDPCYKVLPAALKKYKINDDWRLYALFICYGNTERCLAYDEKPLLLFQRLKESNDNPVFMLRHIKDIKSPISVASAKHAARREKRQPGVGGGVERSLMGVNRDGSVTTNASGLVGNARPTRLHHPPVLLPVGKKEEDEEGKEDDKEKEKDKSGYCIAIYPYLAEREDEFDVAVGDTFIILSKTKGWWVVHRDTLPSLSSSTSSNPSSSSKKSAWVPAGCLLETSVPPLSLSTEPLSTSSSINAASIPILPSYVVSVSTPGIALMDYSPRGGTGGGTGELEVKKGAPLRILKRYNHWSYAIKEDGGRGWVPSWFCGRATNASKGDATPTSPTALPPPPTAMDSGTRPSTAPSVQQPSTLSSGTSNLKPNISIALPSPGVGAGAGGAKSAGPVMSGGNTGGGGGGMDGDE